MIKSLFDEIEEKSQTKTEEINQPEAQTKPIDLSEAEELLEISDLRDATPTETPILQDTETTTEILPPTEILILQDAEIIDEKIEQPEISVSHGAKTIDELRLQSNISNSRNPPTEMPAKDESAFFQTETKPESFAETARKSGLAMSAAITLFASVVFLLVIGWFADLLLGTSPWGIVGGIVLGSIIGFFQFFRMTSQILKNKD
jgi:F0F1-type ATP synthase assembly protein I